MAAEGVAVAGVLHDTSMTLVAVGMLALVVEGGMALRAVLSQEILRAALVAASVG